MIDKISSNTTSKDVMWQFVHVFNYYYCMCGSVHVGLGKQACSQGPGL